MKTKLLLSAVFLAFGTMLYAQTGINCSSPITVAPANTCMYQSFTTTTDQMWFKFVAQSKDVNISVLTTKFGINTPHIHNITLYSGACSSLNYITDDELPYETNADKLSIDLNASGLTIGNTYFIKANRKALNDDCDKGTCKAGGSTTPTTFNLCIENISVLVPLDFGLELPVQYHAYEQNRGQLADLSGNPMPQIKMFTKSNPVVYIANNYASLVFEKFDKDSTTTDTLHRVDMTFPGSNVSTRVFKTEQLPGINNYYLPHIPKGITNNKSFSRSVVQEIYPNIDLEYYSNYDGLKFYFIVKPGGNANLIKIKFNGASSTNTTAAEGLNIKTVLGNYTFEKAHVYKINPANNIVPMPVSGKFVKTGADEYQVYLQNYPPDNMPLIIQIDRGHSTASGPPADPEWGTFYGGSKDDVAYDMATDPSGNLYSTGTTGGGTFPVSPGAMFITFRGGFSDAFVSKFNYNYSRIWTTFFGGNDYDDGYGITYDKLNDKVYVCGQTQSTGTTFPVQALTASPNSYADNTSAFYKGFIARINPGLNGTLEWSTKFGGSYGYCNKIKSDANGNVFVIGQISFTGITATCMPSGGAFPICDPGSGAYSQSVHASATFGGSVSNTFYYDGYIAKFNSLTELKWSTLFGGMGEDYMNNLFVDDVNQKLYIVGGTKSKSTSTTSCGVPSVGGFPLCNTGGSFFFSQLNSYNLDYTLDGFVSKFSLNGNLEWSTFIGSSSEDVANDVVTDNVGNVFITGYTKAGFYGNNPCSVPTDGGFPSCAGTSYTQAFGGGYDIFVTKFSPTGGLQWSSFFGSNYDDIAVKLMEGPRIGLNTVNNNIYIGGNTRSCNTLPLKADPTYYQQNQNSDAPCTNGTTDCFITSFDNSGNWVYSSFFGGKGGTGFPQTGDLLMGLTTYQGRIYICGQTYSSSLFPLFCPTTTSPYCQSYAATVSNAFYAQLAKSLVGINEITKDKYENFKIYPNPSNSSVNFEWNNTGSKKAEISIYNAIGQLIRTVAINETSGTNTFNLNVSEFKQAIYLVVIKTQTQTLNAKFIKE